MSTPTIIVYGISNCDTVKKARAWLQSQGLTHQFHDFKKQGVPADRLPAWAAAAGWEKLLNRQGTTWRKLDAAAQASVINAASATALMQQQPSVIKRPVVEWQGTPAGEVTVGFSAEAWGARNAASAGNARTPGQSKS
ncbi:ArsC family reductase [Diaphorobacter sp.]|uniref:ArsC family reductase n=1 Tax=Diaphorobacter sp. TaxID=1934310 RepID=UPI003D09BB4B